MCKLCNIDYDEIEKQVRFIESEHEYDKYMKSNISRSKYLHAIKYGLILGWLALFVSGAIFTI